MQIVLQKSLLSGLVLHLRINYRSKPHVRLLKQISHVVFHTNQSISSHEHAVVVIILRGLGMKELNLADLIEERVN